MTVDEISGSRCQLIIASERTEQPFPHKPIKTGNIFSIIRTVSLQELMFVLLGHLTKYLTSFSAGNTVEEMRFRAHDEPSC